MRTYLLNLFFLLFFGNFAFSQTNIIQNGDFSAPNDSWLQSGNFYYNTSFPYYCSGPGSAFTANSGGFAIDNASGSIYQNTSTIPNDAIGAVLSFSTIIYSQNSINPADKLQVTIESNGIIYTVFALTNLNVQSCNQWQVDVSQYIVPHKNQSVIVRFTSSQYDDGAATIFEVDDVSLNVVSGNIETSTGFVTWHNNELPTSQEVIDAAENLCGRGIISNYQSVIDLKGYSMADAALATVISLYAPAIPPNLPTDNYPIMVTDLEVIPYAKYQAIKALSFLESSDGRPCIKRDYFNISPTKTISYGGILRMLLEAWNFAPDTVGYNVNNHSASSFLCNVLIDDPNYGYFKRALSLGLLSAYVNNNCFSEPSNGEFFYVVLHRLLMSYGTPTPTETSYFNPNNNNIQNGTAVPDITQGAFNSYEQSGFSIPSGGIGLSFGFSYHSNLVDFPFIVQDNGDLTFGNLANHQAILHDHPLGKGWTHTYNIYAQVSRGLISSSSNILDDKYYIFHWGDGSTTIYDITKHAFTNKSVHDTLIIDQTDNNAHITNFHILTKTHTTISFSKSNNEFQCVQIQDRKGNKLNFSYELAACLETQTNCRGSSALRLKYIIDIYSGRKLEFFYQTNTDLISEVKDNSNRSFKFYCNEFNYTLDSVINPKSQTTKYLYGATDTGANLLVSIIKPRGNIIKNDYYQRKLKQTETPNYKVSVDFTANYTATAINTNSAVLYTPTQGTTYKTSYVYDSLGNIRVVTSNTVRLGFSYQDTLNPALPTSIRDNATQILKAYVYDRRGNTSQYTYSSLTSPLIQIDYYTYDSFSNVQTHQWPNGTVMTYKYDEVGNRILDSGPLNYKYTYVYNADRTLQYKKDAVGNITRFGYNSYGNINSIAVNGTTISLSAFYDPASRITKIIDGDTAATTYSYDENDNITRVIVDSGGLSLTTRYSYDSNDNLAYVIAPKGDTTLLTYNDNDDLIKERYGKSERSWAYFDDGTLNYYMNKKGLQLRNEYYPPGDQNEGKLKTNSYGMFDYDEASHLLKSVKDLTDTKKISYEYDPLARISKTRFDAKDFHSSVSYTYHIENNKLESLSLPTENKTIYYTYDKLNRPYQILDWNNTPIVTYYYYDNGLPYFDKFGNGASVYYLYDKANRLDSIIGFRNDSTKIYAVGCDIDNNGNHTRESYFVDWKGSIISDPVSDSLVSYTYNYNNVLTEQNGKDVISDANGNTLRNYTTGMNTGTYEAAYDSKDNLTSINIDGMQRAYSYDGLENRYYNNSLRYVLDYTNNSNVLVITDVRSQTTKDIYVYSPDGSLICSIDPATSARTYYLYDFRGSTVATVNDGNKITQFYKYDPFGNIIESSVIPGSTTPFLFVGKYGVMYESPHLYFMRARYYDPTIGRFLGEDPKWNTNLFKYANNNPLSNIDPSGTFSEQQYDISDKISSIIDIHLALSQYGIDFYDGIKALTPLTEKFGKFVKGFGYVTGIFSSAVALRKAYYHPSAANFMNLAFNVGLIFVKDNPLILATIATLNFTGATDFIFSHTGGLFGRLTNYFIH